MPDFTHGAAPPAPPSDPKAERAITGLREAERRIQAAIQSNEELLDLTGLELSHLPHSLSRLTSLRVLLAWNNELVELPKFIGELAHLQNLDVSNNQLRTLPESIGSLLHLRNLDASDNQLTSLPESIKRLTTLESLFLHGNDALGLPREVLGRTWKQLQGQESRYTGPASILDYYFRTRRSRQRLNEAKLILVGRGGVGKTCLIKRLIHDTFNELEPETPGIEIQHWSVQVPDGDWVRLHVWDFGGQEILHATHQFFLTERTLYLLVLSGREGNPTQDAEYWLQLIKSFGGDSPVIIVLNKSRRHPFDVNRGLLLEKYPFIVDFIRTDCQDAMGVFELRALINSQTASLESRKADFPSDWFTIKERLAGMRENFVTWDRYQEICRGFGEKEPDAQRHLAGFLHILGIALNYRDDPRLRDTHVLNPRWVTEGIYTLLRASQKARSHGILTKSDLAKALNIKSYPADCHDFLLRLMERFQLCFLLPGREKRYLVPELLDENQPNIKALLDAPGLGFRYQYEILPEGLLPRFIVQTHAHSESGPQRRWRTGVVLERDGCQAVVRSDARERRVDIHITGNESQRRGLLAIIREKFEEQHRDLKGLFVDERVPVPGGTGTTVSYRHLLELEEDGETSYRPEGMRTKVLVADLLNGVETPASRRQRRAARDGLAQLSDAAHGGLYPRAARVFISYSRKDASFLDELLVHLRPLERLGLVSKWSDRDIAPGSQSHEEIASALSSAKLAVMLVSPDFIASDYIHGHELAPLLKEAEEGGIRILWIPVRACLYQATTLHRHQPVISPDKPLAQMGADRDEAWVKISKAIMDALS